MRSGWPSAVVLAAVLASGSSASRAAGTYSNPLPMTTPSGAPVENCADPTVIRGQKPSDTDWYLYCTSDPLNDQDKGPLGNWNIHLISIHRSPDLVHWTYVGDVFDARPAWVVGSAGIWAPDIAYFGNKYHLYYAVTDTQDAVSGEPGCGSDSAIGVATATSPAGPWTDHGSPVVAPRRAGSGCNFYATIDPEIVTDASGQKWIYYGSYGGGIEVRQLSSDGFTAPASTAVRIALSNRYEGTFILPRDGYYYFLGSSTSCCNGPLTGYGVFAARSTSPTGPFVDRDGVSLLSGRIGGTPVLAMNGSLWVGPGHNTALTDFAGQDWIIYHAIDRSDPYFEGSVGYTRRPAFMDALDWVDGWPVARGGFGPSSCPQEAPAAQPGQTTGYVPVLRGQDLPGSPVPEASDEFDGTALGPQWSWIRPPDPGAWGLSGGSLRFDTQNGDLYVDDNSAPVLVEPAPPGDFLAETRLRLSVPSDGCCYDYRQAGIVVYRDDDNYVRLDHVSIGETRQIEFAKEVSPVPAGYPRFGSSAGGPVGDWTWLRIARRALGGEERYTAYSSLDGTTWVRGSTWTHALGPGTRIGLLSMGGSGYTATFDYVRVYRLLPEPDDPQDPPVPEVSGLRLGGGAATTLTWDPADRADVYDVARGSLSGLPAGDYGACLANDVASTSTADSEVPSSGEGFSYLVRGVALACRHRGPWGIDRWGSEIVDTNPSACP